MSYDITFEQWQKLHGRLAVLEDAAAHPNPFKRRRALRKVRRAAEVRQQFRDGRLTIPGVPR